MYHFACHEVRRVVDQDRAGAGLPLTIGAKVVRLRC